MSTAPAFHPSDSHSLHETIAAAVVAGIELATNAYDAQAVASRFAVAATWTNAMGTRIVGRAEIAAAGDGLMPRLAAGPMRCTIVAVKALRPDVLMVNVLQSAADEHGDEVPEAATLALYVIERGAEGWVVAAGQNTLIAELD